MLRLSFTSFSTTVDEYNELRVIVYSCASREEQFSLEKMSFIGFC